MMNTMNTITLIVIVITTVRVTGLIKKKNTNMKKNEMIYFLLVLFARLSKSFQIVFYTLTNNLINLIFFSVINME